jgi:hypothetical protein
MSESIMSNFLMLYAMNHYRSVNSLDKKDLYPFLL